MTRKGSWIQTYSGKAFYPFDPRPEDFCIEDIAHSLALQCRFAGHCFEPYSVAEHSVRVSLQFEKRHPYAHPKLILGAQLHDAPEAYILDFPRPLKRDLRFRSYVAVEMDLADRIAQAFGLEPWTLHSDAVKNADNILLATEARDLMAPPPMPWEFMPEPLPEKIVPWSWRKAESTFLDRFKELQARIAERV